ncbi:MAG: hypothetical protein IH623_02260 [Verrucomicrobia bacterium]|nr:hypothetical protein [Verrucomicrobiota bacterium]
MQAALAEPARFAILVPSEPPPPAQTIQQVVLHAPTPTIYSMDLRLTYDPPTTPVLGIQVGTLAGGMMLATNIPEPGVILAGLAGASPIGGEGAVLSVTFGAPAGVILALTEASVNEGSLSSVITVNTAPVLSVPPDQIISRLQTLAVTNAVTDADVPTNALSFALVSGPDGMSVDVRTGVLTWTPNSSHGPSINLILVKVSDNGVPALSATNSFTVVALGTNRSPVLAEITDKLVHAGSVVTFTNVATDPDLPMDTLTFSLGAGAPPGAGINPFTGIFTWATTDADMYTTNSITVFVTDDGVPNLEDARTFTVTVVSPLMIKVISVTDDEVTITWNAIIGQSYRLQYKDTIESPVWNDTPEDVLASGPDASQNHTVQTETQKMFYRLIAVP